MLELKKKDSAWVGKCQVTKEFVRKFKNYKLYVTMTYEIFIDYFS